WDVRADETSGYCRAQNAKYSRPTGSHLRNSALDYGPHRPATREATKMMRALLAASLCAGWALAGTDLAHAQAYPTRPIRIVVPFPAAGPTHRMARIVSDRLSA